MKFWVKKVNSDFWFSVTYKGINITFGIASSKKEALDAIFYLIKTKIRLIENLEVI